MKRYVKVMFLLLMIGSNDLLAQQNVITKKDLKNFSFALLDGENVALYADLAIGRKSGAEGSGSRAANLMDKLFFMEKNFRGGQTWMIRMQLEKELKGVTYGTEVRFSDEETHVFARALSDLGIVYHHLGLLAKSEKVAIRAFNLRNDRFGNENIATISSMNNLAALYKDMGKYSESEKLFDQALNTLERQERQNDIEYAVVLNNKSTLQLVLGQTEEAKQTSSESIQIADLHTGDKSKDFISFLLNSAIIHQELKHFPKAEELLQKIKLIKEKRFGKKSSQYARTLNNIAALYMEMNRTSEVEPLLKTALGLYKKQYGENHPTTANILGNLGRYYRTIGDYKNAIEILNRAKKVQGYILGKYHPDFLETVEALALSYWETDDINSAITEFTVLKKGLLDQVTNYFPAMSEDNKTKFWDNSRHFLMKYYSFVIANKDENPNLLGDVYDIHLLTKGLLLSESVKVKQTFLNMEDGELKTKYLEWASMKEDLIKYHSMQKKAVFSMGVNMLKFGNRVKSIEAELSELSNQFIKPTSDLNYSFLNVQEKLESDEAAIEIIRVDEFDKRFTGKVNYLALVVSKDSKLPEMAVMTNGVELETKNYKRYSASIRFKSKDKTSYGAYWKPIADKLGTAKNIYLSQDGIYNQVNINTFLDENNQSVIENYRISFLSSTRQLLKSESASEYANNDVVLLGSPNFGNSTYAPLPATETEINTIGQYLTDGGYDIQTFTNKLATEQNFKTQINNPKILHVATHGFFLEDKSSSKNKRVFGTEVKRKSVNPLLNSGLVLANASNAVGVVSSTEEDGLLTAYEAMNLRLENTDLVVLSACETGLGEVKAGEGVYGLQRAFQVAGTNAIITSLWKVNDEATQELMTNFYQVWIDTNDKQAAFVSAQRKIKDKYKDPYYWGAFVLMQ